MRDAAERGTLVGGRVEDAFLRVALQPRRFDPANVYRKFRGSRVQSTLTRVSIRVRKSQNTGAVSQCTGSGKG